MKFPIISVLLVFILSISIISCSNNKSNDARNNESSDTNISTSSSSMSTNASADSKIENTENILTSKTQSASISVEEIYDILVTKNNNIIDTLGLSDSDHIKSFNDSNFYVPVFRCAKSGILIGFNGTQNDSIENVRKKDETPDFIIPIDETVIKLDDNIRFRVGDSMKEFKEKFGEGISGKEGNLKGDKEFSILTYRISNLEIRFTSLSGDDFKKYEVYISKLK